MSDQGGSGPAAGWYPDPEVPGGQRYWDGTRWTEDRHPPPSEQPASDGWQSDGWQSTPPSSQPPAWRSTPNAGQPTWSSSGAANVDPWLWQSIVATLLCCLPVGIVAIVRSTQARSALDVGNGPLAQRRASEARTWTLVSVGLGLIGYVLYFGVMGTMAV